MKKKLNPELLNSENPKSLSELSQKETDVAFLANITLRKEENEALKKLLNNLETTLPKNKV